MSSKYANKIKEILKSNLAQTNFNRVARNCKLLSVDEGKIKVEFEVTEEHTNSMQTLHGGCTATLIDITTSTAILASDSTNSGVSVDLNVSYLSPAKIGDKVTIEASVVKKGKNLCFTKANLYQSASKVIIAKGLHTKFIPFKTSNL